MAAKSKEILEIACPDCGAMLKIDVGARAVISHTPAPRKRTFEDGSGPRKKTKERGGANKINYGSDDDD